MKHILLTAIIAIASLNALSQSFVREFSTVTYYDDTTQMDSFEIRETPGIVIFYPEGKNTIDVILAATGYRQTYYVYGDIRESVANDGVTYQFQEAVSGFGEVSTIAIYETGVVMIHFPKPKNAMVFRP